MYLSAKIHIASTFAMIIQLSLSSLNDQHAILNALFLTLILTSFGSGLWLVANMAEYRKRSATIWILVSLFLYFYIGMLLLKLLGSSDPEPYEEWIE